MGFIYLIIAFTLNATGNALLKLSSEKGFVLNSFMPVAIARDNSVFLSGLFLFTVNVVFYTLALRALPLSLAYPIMVVGSFVLVSAFSLIYFKESITILQIAGYCAILGGIALVMFAKSSS